MKIKKIEITGFKSFVDRSVVLFDHEVTGIVGPNGCGKSNIVDAIRWVMGEQSAKNLRGRAMEDVIFNGSETRGPHGFAEVALTFDNGDGLTPPEYRDYPEITVTRRLDRQGRSDYLINRTQVRLMDITNLFLGTGVGTRAYSIIEQGRIGFIVSSKPVDRRHLIDEAAGVTKFKARKRAAERKMDHTRDNLNRVSDIVQEIERTLASLKRQAQKAERYRRYRDELRGLELHVASHRFLELSAEHRFAKSSSTESNAVLEGQRLALRFREAESDLKRTAANELENQVERAQTEAFEQENGLQLVESQMDRARERIRALREAEVRLGRDLEDLAVQGRDVEDELEKARGRQAQAEAVEKAATEILQEAQASHEEKRATAREDEQALLQIRQTLAEKARVVARAEAELAEAERVREGEREKLSGLRRDLDTVQDRRIELGHEERELVARLAALREGKERTVVERQGVEEELKRLQGEISESDGIVEALRDELSERRSRLRSLGEIHERFEGVAGGARALMTYAEASDAEAGVVGLLADRLDCPSEWTAALSAVLGHRIEHIVVKSAEHGVEALRHLADGKLGRATVIPQTPRERSREDAPTPTEPGVVGFLKTYVSVRPEDQKLSEYLLGDVLVVESPEIALRLHKEGSWRGALVTSDGTLFHADGSVTGGAGDDVGAHLLSMKRELRELEETVGGLTSQLEVAQHKHGELRTAIASRQASLEATKTESHDTELATVTAEKDLKSVHDEARVGAENEERFVHAVAELEAKLSDQTALGEARASIEQARQEEHEVAARIGAAEAQLERRRQIVEGQSERVTEVRVEAAQATERAESERLTVSRLLNTIKDVERRRARLEEEHNEGAEEQGTFFGELLRHADQREIGRAAVQECNGRLRGLRERYESARQESQLLETDLRHLRSILDEGTSDVADLSIKERELALELEHLLAQVQERYRTDIHTHLLAHHTQDPLEQEGLDRIEELNRLIDRMGDINLTAIEEFEEKSERHQYLTSQREDLQSALAQLERAIRQMNKESRRLFQEAFSAVNERFQRVFPAMFGGGRAELRLSDPENLLESGVEIIAQPPGKRLGSLELMSGGEKALTAVSLIFAIFQYRPSPFCLLDEVDAPLDEANIGRFSDAVRAMTDRSQFILITHAKRTMEAADVLYGVTMEEPGVSKLVSVEMKNQSKTRLETSTVAVA